VPFRIPFQLTHKAAVNLTNRVSCLIQELPIALVSSCCRLLFLERLDVVADQVDETMARGKQLGKKYVPAWRLDKAKEGQTRLSEQWENFGLRPHGKELTN
jgi:hypothetical protein